MRKPTLGEIEVLAGRLDQYAKTARGERRNDLKSAARVCDDLVRLCVACGEIAEQHPAVAWRLHDAVRGVVELQ